MFTAPDSPSSNGFAERAIQKINRSIRTALLEFKVSEMYWLWASIDAVNKYNALPRSEAPNLIPNDGLPKPTEIPLEHFLSFGVLGFIASQRRIPWRCVRDIYAAIHHTLSVYFYYVQQKLLYAGRKNFISSQQPQ